MSSELNFSADADSKFLRRVSAPHTHHPRIGPNLHAQFAFVL